MTKTTETILWLLMVSILHHSGGTDTIDYHDGTGNTVLKATDEISLPSKSIIPTSIALPTIEEIILEEEFISIPKEKVANQKPDTALHEPDNNNKHNATDLNSIKLGNNDATVSKLSKKKFSSDELKEEDIEALDATDIPTTTPTPAPTTPTPAPTTPTPAPTTPTPAPTTPTPAPTTPTPAPTTTATKQKCTQNDDVTATGCDFANYETCGTDNTCECFSGYDKQNATEKCKKYINFFIQLSFIETKAEGYSEYTSKADPNCPDSLKTYVDDVVGQSQFANYFFPLRDLYANCDDEINNVDVNMTLAFLSDDVSSQNDDDIADIFTTADVPSPFDTPTDTYAIDTSTVSYSPQICDQTSCDPNAVCNDTSDGVCVCIGSYIDLSPVNSSGFKCGMCTGGCENGRGSCVANTETFTAVCQCDSWLYFGDSCDQNYGVIIGVSVGAGVLVIAAAVIGGVLWHRKNKLKKLDAEARVQEIESFRPPI